MARARSGTSRRPVRIGPRILRRTSPRVDSRAGTGDTSLQRLRRWGPGEDQDGAPRVAMGLEPVKGIPRTQGRPQTRLLVCDNRRYFETVYGFSRALEGQICHAAT